MQRIQLHSMLLLVLALCSAGCGGSSDDSDIEGTWKITKMATNGAYLPQDKINSDGSIVLEGNRYIRKQKDEVVNEWTFTLDSSKNPKQLLISRGESGGKERFSYLIYKIEGDTLTTKSGSSSFPADFSTETDRGCYLTVYQRASK